MTTSKFATIHGGLLVRKGEAAPAVRHPGRDHGYTDLPRREASASALTPAEEGARDLRAVGAPPTAAALIAERPELPPKPRPCAFEAPPDPVVAENDGDDAPLSKTTVRLTARQKHLIKIATAALGRSQQVILSSALDSYLQELGTNELRSCGCFVRHLPRTDADPAVPQETIN